MLLNLNCNPIKNFKFEPSNYNILIIEDSKSVNKILNKTFSELEYNCFSAFTLSGAKEILQNEDIHYLMLDINLPDGNGYELIKQLEDTPEKIFVLTTETDKQFRDISYQKGVIDFIVKDKDFFFKINQISATIEQLEKNRFKSVLVIDDSLVIQEQLKDMLGNRYYHVETAPDSVTALNILNKQPIDMILLDLQLKDINGIEFLQKNKTELIDKRKIPVIIVSGNIEPSTIRDGIKAGAVDLIQKPYIIEELILKVDLWIDYKRKEEEVLCSQQLLNQYKETVDRSAIVSKADPNGIITYVNDEFCKISGYSEEELIGKPHNIVRHPDMDTSVFEFMWYTIKDLKQPWTGEVKNRKKDGNPYWVKAIINPILDINGDVIEYIGIRTDITQQEQIKQYFEKQLNISTKKFSSALNLSKEYEKAINESAILTRSDLEGNLTYVNKRFLEISGYTEEEVIGQNHRLVRHPDTPVEVFKELWGTIQEGKIWKGIFKNKNKQGNSYWVDTTIVPIHDENKEIIEYMAIRHDLTELFNLHHEIEETQREVVYKMGEIGETRSKETGQHVKRVAEYSKELALLYGLSKEEADILFTASPMHDIGKVGIPDSILKKPGKLTEDEFEQMKIHCETGYNILKGSNREVLKAAAIVSYEHHEKYNGKGYPRGLKREDIHIYGRITAIADVFDALGSDRAYKKAWDDEKIFKLFEEEKGEHFDPKLVELFFENKDVFIEIRDKYKD